MTGEARCHCGAPVKVHDGGFTRGLCADCDEVRCDVDGKCGAVTGEALTPAQVIAEDICGCRTPRSCEEHLSDAVEVIAALDRAGYVIVPRDLLDLALEDAGYWCGHTADGTYEHAARLRAGATPRKDG